MRYVCGVKRYSSSLLSPCTHRYIAPISRADVGGAVVPENLTIDGVGVNVAESEAVAICIVIGIGVGIDIGLGVSMVQPQLLQ